MTTTEKSEFQNSFTGPWPFLLGLITMLNCMPEKHNSLQKSLKHWDFRPVCFVKMFYQKTERVSQQQPGHPPPCLPNDLHEYLNILMSCTAGDIQRSQHQRLAQGQDSRTFQNGLPYYRVLRAHTGLLLGDARLLYLRP